MPMRVHYSTGVRKKLQEKHGVSEKEVSECFENRIKGLLVDDREEHKTDPATLWFIAETNQRRLLKIVFIAVDKNVHIKTAYEPNAIETSIYNTKA